MRRAALAILGTVAGTTLMIGAKWGAPAASADPSALGLVAADGDGSSAAQTAPDDDAYAALAAATTSTSGQRASRGARPAASAPPGATGSGSGLKDGTFTQSTAYVHGNIQVTVTVDGGKLTDINAKCSCTGTAATISENAFSKLRQEAMLAQSASIATVSGATYTSAAYLSSLQAALDAARA